MIPVTLRTGQSTIVATPHLTRVAVGDGKIAGVLAVGNTEIVISGRTAGRTTLLVWTAYGRRTYDVTVTEQSLESLRQMMQGAISDPGVHVDALDRSIVINGSVAERRDAGPSRRSGFALRAVAAAAGKFTLVNAVTVAQPLGPLQSELAASPDTAGVHVDRDVKGNLIVSGQVADRTTAEHVLHRVRALGGPYLAIDGKVIDRIETATVSQVDVKVYILEVDETALRQLGVNLQSATFHPDGTYTLGGPQFPVVEDTPKGYGNARAPAIPAPRCTIGAFFRSITLAPTLNLIMQSGHARAALVARSRDDAGATGRLSRSAGRSRSPSRAGLSRSRSSTRTSA